MKILSLPIREFALPVPRSGSLEAHSGYGVATSEGQEIHSIIQKKRADKHEDYRSEVRISHSLEREGYLFQIGGRMDGVFDQDPPKIEEIKTTFQIQDLFKQLVSRPMTHPYCLQLKTYGYFYWLQHKVMPILSFHLVSSRNYESEDLEIKLDIAEYEKWLQLRLDELIEEAKAQEQRVRKRKKIAKQLQFPFPSPRSGQVELMDSIENAIRSRSPILVQAPTGLGKTMGSLYPILKEALSRGQNVVYVTPKNSQHALAEAAITKFRESGHSVRSLTITAKSKVCMKNEPLCNPDYCEYSRDYYTKVAENDLLSLLARKRKLNSQVFRELAEEYEVCPFQLQLDCAATVEAIICDYNYVFGPRSLLDRTRGVQFTTSGSDSSDADEDQRPNLLPNLLIDEAHNLPSRAMDYYSPALSSLVLRKMLDEIHPLPKIFQTEVKELIHGCLQTIQSCCPEGASQATKISPPVESFLEQEVNLRNFLSRYLASTVEIKPRDPVLRLCFYWSEFTAALKYVTDPKRTEFFTTFHRAKGDTGSGALPLGGTVKITCCDASAMLQACYENYHQTVGFSATLKPFDFYSKLSGLPSETLKTAEFGSPFEKSNRKILIIPQISTKYSDRERNYPRIADAITKIISLKPGNYFAFFPSFIFMEKVLGLFTPPPGFTVLAQEREMKASQTESILEHLRRKETPTLVLAVQGGVFAEGVDYPGDMVIGAFVIGPSLPAFDLEREEMKNYYERNYQSGFDYAYTYPAMAKSIQAAGRVIRSETDRGIIVLMDNRFLNPKYSQSMPKDWFHSHPAELVSEKILKDLSDFWDSGKS